PLPSTTLFRSALLQPADVDPRGGDEHHQPVHGQQADRHQQLRPQVGDDQRVAKRGEHQPCSSVPLPCSAGSAAASDSVPCAASDSAAGAAASAAAPPTRAWTVPPAAVTAAYAERLATSTVMVRPRVSSSPLPSSLMGRSAWRIRPEARSSAAVTTVPSSNTLRSPSWTSWNSSFCRLKPRFGSRMMSEERPPSQPARWLKPLRLFWPFWPRTAVLPRPLPMPRPTRRRAFLEPAEGLRSASFIALAFRSRVGTRPWRPCPPSRGWRGF